MLIEVTPEVKLLRPAGKTVYPYSNSVYLDDEIKTMIDSGTGGQAYAEICADKIEQVLLSHYHFDHVNGVSFFPHAAVYAGREEAAVYLDPELYLQHTGRFRWSELMATDKTAPLLARQGFPDDIPVNPGFQAIELKGSFENGQIFDLGKTKLRAVHLPGHTAGHYGFYIEKEGLLFSGDLDLAPQGPWYGGESSDLEQLINSIDRIVDINPHMLITSHRRVFKAPRDNIIQMLQEYKKILLEREKKTLEVLSQPRSIDDIVKSAGVFPQAGSSEYTMFYAKMMTMKHLQYLIQSERVDKIEAGYFVRR